MYTTSYATVVAPKVPQAVVLIILLVKVNLVIILLNILTRSGLPLDEIFEAVIASSTYCFARVQSFKYVEVAGDSKQYTLD